MTLLCLRTHTHRFRDGGEPRASTSSASYFNPPQSFLPDFSFGPCPTTDVCRDLNTRTEVREREVWSDLNWGRWGLDWHTLEDAEGCRGSDYWLRSLTVSPGGVEAFETSLVTTRTQPTWVSAHGSCRGPCVPQGGKDKRLSRRDVRPEGGKGGVGEWCGVK